MPMVRVQPSSADNGQTRGKRPRKVVENRDFSAFATRILRAFAKRVGSGDVEALPDLVAFSRQADEAIARAVSEDDSVRPVPEVSFDRDFIAAADRTGRRQDRERDIVGEEG